MFQACFHLMDEAVFVINNTILWSSNNKHYKGAALKIVDLSLQGFCCKIAKHANGEKIK